MVSGQTSHGDDGLMEHLHIWVKEEAYNHWRNCRAGGLDGGCHTCLTIMEVYGGAEWFQRYQEVPTES